MELRPGEGRPLLLLFAYACAMGAGNTLLDSSANALFLTYFDVGMLPYTYVASAVFTVAFGVAYSRLESRVTAPVLLTATAATLLVSIALFYTAVSASSSRWLALALMMWKDVQFILAAIVLWALAGMLFDLRQGKRLFGLIGAGDVLAIIAAGLAVPFIVRAVGTVNLLAFATAAQVATFALLAVILTSFRDRLAPEVDTSITKGPRRPRSALDIARDPFVALLFGVSVLSYLGYYVVDYLFYDRVDAMYPTTDALASFYGLFAAVMGAVNLAANLFLSGPVMTRYGVRFALLVLPVVIALGAGLSLAASLGIAGASAAWLIIGTKLLDEVFRKSIEGPSYRVLYQPLPRAERMRVQALRESVVEPAAMGLAGVLLLVLGTWLQLSIVELLWFLAGITIAWLLFARRLGARYVGVLRHAIARRRVSGIETALSDVASTRLVGEFLSSADAVEVMYALRILENAGDAHLTEHCMRLADHPEHMVREHVMRALERRGDVRALPVVRTRAAVETDPTIRGLAARAWCALTLGDAVDDVTDMAARSDLAARRGALAGLLKHGGIDGVLAAGPLVQSLAESTDARERAVAAEILGDTGMPGFHRPLHPLLKDPELDVRRAAIRAAGAIAHPRLVGLVIDQLEVPALSDAVASAVVAFADNAVDPLIARIDDLARPSASRRRAAALLGRITTLRASTALRARLDCADAQVRGQVLLALERGARATPSDRSRLAGVVRREAEWQASLYFAMDDVAPHDDLAHFSDALAQEARRARDRMLTALAVLHPGDAMAGVRLALASTVSERRAQAIEVVDTTIARPLREFVIPLLEESALGDRVAQLADVFPRDRRAAEDHLANCAMLQPGACGSWLRAIAIHLLATRYVSSTPAAQEANEQVPASITNDPEPIVREAARWFHRRTGRLPQRGWTLATS